MHSRKLSVHLHSDYHGVLIISAEIIPIEPDAGNADAGIKRYNQDKKKPLFHGYQPGVGASCFSKLKLL